MTTKNEFKEGQTIVHPKYGKGTIVGFPSGGYYVRVQFENDVRDFNPVNLALVIRRNAHLQ